MDNRLRKYLTLFNVVILIGMAISVFLAYEHFTEVTSAYCTFGESFDCGVVNKSPYANVDGLSYLFTIDFGWPLRLIDISGINVFFDFITSNAVLGFLVLLFLLLLNTRNAGEDFLFVRSEKRDKWIKGITVFGVLYGGYLFLIQHFVLKMYCIFCLGLDVVLISLAVMAFMEKR